MSEAGKREHSWNTHTLSSSTSAQTYQQTTLPPSASDNQTTTAHDTYPYACSTLPEAGQQCTHTCVNSHLTS
ncbi:hypothetical protein YC2023_104908 [Brassica napus]